VFRAFWAEPTAKRDDTQVSRFGPAPAAISSHFAETSFAISLISRRWAPALHPPDLVLRFEANVNHRKRKALTFSNRHTIVDRKFD
jgi:hypothetical protein